MSEMERDTVNHKLAIIEFLNRPEFDDDLGEWRQRRKRGEREVKHYLPQVGGSLNEPMRIAVVRQRTPGELQKHLKLNAMQYGEKYGAFHDLIEAFFGADEDEPVDNTYGSFQVGLVGKGVGKETLLVRNETDYHDKKCFLCVKPGHFARECRSAAYQKGYGKSMKGTQKGDGKSNQNQKGAQKD